MEQGFKSVAIEPIYSLQVTSSPNARVPEFSVGILHSKRGARPQTGIFRETGEFIVFAESIPTERALGERIGLMLLASHTGFPEAAEPDRSANMHLFNEETRNAGGKSLLPIAVFLRRQPEASSRTGSP